MSNYQGRILAKSLWHLKGSSSEIRVVEIPQIEDGQVHITAKYSCISFGTESLVRHGKVPQSMHDKMRVPYMQGAFDSPIKYGYSLVGVTSEGNPVHIMHPHQDRMYVHEKDCFLLPPSLPMHRAALISNTETCLNAIWDARLIGGESIAIIGYGGIGALLAQVLQTYSQITADVFDTDYDRMQLLTQHSYNKLGHDGNTYDVIFHTSASDDGLQMAMKYASPEGRIIEMSWYGDRSTKVSLGTDFHYKRLQLLSSQVSTVSPYAPGSGYRWRKEQCVEVLHDPSFDKLITIIPFEEVVGWWDNDQGRKELVVVIGYR